MHELLAVCLVVVDRDSLVAEPNRPSVSPLSATPAAVCEEAMVTTLDRAFVEHDAFQLFIQLMKPAKVFYEWRSEEGVVSVIVDRVADTRPRRGYLEPSRRSSRDAAISTGCCAGSTRSCGRDSRARASSRKYGPCGSTGGM